MQGLFDNYQMPTVEKSHELNEVKNEITRLCQETNPEITKNWVHWRIINNVYPRDTESIKQLLYRAESKAKHDKISFEFAFKILTKK